MGNVCKYYDENDTIFIKSNELTPVTRFTNHRRRASCSHPENPFKDRKAVNTQPQCQGNIDNCTFGLNPDIEIDSIKV